jgi:hypothetical protein
LDSFFNKPLLIDATPVLYRKSLEKYRKKSISLVLEVKERSDVDGLKETHNSPTLSMFEECHRCRRRSMSSKNLREFPWVHIAKRQTENLPGVVAS